MLCAHTVCVSLTVSHFLSRRQVEENTQHTTVTDCLPKLFTSPTNHVTLNRKWGKREREQEKGCSEKTARKGGIVQRSRERGIAPPFLLMLSPSCRTTTLPLIPLLIYRPAKTFESLREESHTNEDEERETERIPSSRREKISSVPSLNPESDMRTDFSDALAFRFQSELSES